MGDNFDINNNTAGLNDFYEDYSSLFYADVTEGQMYTVNVTAGNLGSPPAYSYDPQVINIYIDFNIDGDFSDPGEDIGLINIPWGTWNYGIVYPFSFMVPTTGFYGATRMRVVCMSNAGAIVNMGPCESPIGRNTPWFGATEDYSIVLNSHQSLCDSIVIIDLTINSCTVYGCTDPNAFNYDANATVDDGSCIPFIYGCTDPIALNYNATATSDDGSCLYPGCPDPNATNYDPNANFDDGSCIYSASCSGDLITGLYVSDIIDDRCVLNFDNMNTYDFNGNQICRVDQIRIKYRPVGTSSWSQKNIASPTGYNNGVCNSTQKTDKNLYGLTLATEYQWQVKVWYCDGQTTGWVQGPNFTTASECPNVGNTNAYGSTPTRATFTWDDSNGAYEFLRIKIRIDSISNPTLSDFIQVGGAGIQYGIFTKNKNGLTPGETYRGQGRTWCDPNGGAYNSLGWTSFGVWTQPTNRIDLGQSIKDLDIYPNPSNDIFNISFTSEDVQDLRVRVMNVIGEELIVEDLQQFVGEYTKKITLGDNAKGIYFLEIETNQGLINKKLVLQ